MRIVQVSAEFAPIAKAGGMGEVVVGLSRELTLQGHQVDIFLPKYDFIDLKKLSQVRLEMADFKTPEKQFPHANAMWSAVTEGCHLHLLEARHPAGYFHRGQIYGYEDDARRFLYFCRSVTEYLKLRNEPIDILHLHDWHSASCAVLARDLLHLPIKGILLTLHNVEYQGRCATWDLDVIGLRGSSYLTADKMQDDDLACPKTINLLKGGLNYADALNTVSPTYALEILTPEMGFHLDKTLRKCRHKLTGILNGIDDKLWDPAHDPYLPTPFLPKNISAAKHQLRELLAKRFHLDPLKRPWVGSITRLAFQKGPELLEEATQTVPSLGGTFLLLGSTTSPQIQSRFEALKKAKQSTQLFLHLQYDEALAHQVYGALDYLLIPSRFEPCGLTQLIGMRYGVVPIARATGGLKDTIVENQNGFLFSDFTLRSMNQALERACSLFVRDPSAFQRLMLSGLSTDWSWKRPAQQYLALYRELLQARPRRSA